MNETADNLPINIDDDIFNPSSYEEGVAVGAGLVTLDVLIDEDNEDSLKLFSGGSCGNVITILSALGWESYPIARLGQDHIAQLIRSDMTQWGVNTQMASSRPGGSSPVIIQRNMEQDHCFETQCPSCETYLPQFKRPLVKRTSEYLSETSDVQVFYFDRAVPATIRLAEEYRSGGALVLFEPNKSSNRDLFKRAINASHILKYSHERDIQLGEIDPPWLHIETIGENGLRFQIKNDSWVQMDAMYPEWVLDTSGAGDWCSAGLLHKLNNNWTGDVDDISIDSVKRGLKFGQALAAMNCKYEGARGALYHWEDNELRQSLSQLHTHNQTISACTGQKSSVVNRQGFPNHIRCLDKTNTTQCICEAIDAEFS